MVECVGSLAMPPIVAILRKKPVSLLLALVLSTFLLAQVGRGTVFSFLCAFAVGSYMAIRGFPVVSGGRYWLFLAAAGLMLFREMWFVALNGSLLPAEYNDRSPILLLSETLFAAMLVGLLADGFAPVLRIRPLVWLGDVSFSLYLLHFPVMVAAAKCIRVNNSVLATGVLMIVTVGTSLGLSSLFFRFVEVPFNALGRGWQKRFTTIHAAQCN